VAELPGVVAQLLRHGRSPETPVALISQGTRDAQRTLVATLADVEARATADGITAPAIVLVGEVVRLREQLRWFE
jgi:uroporphyrinogen III methyltransferase/synthase